MKILFQNWEFPPQGSGIGRYIFNLSQALRDAGHFTVIFTSKSNGFPEIEEMDNGIIYRMLERNDIGNTRGLDAVLKIVQRHQINLIEGADHLGQCAGLLQERERPPVCIKLHYNDVLHELRYSQAGFFWQYITIWLACVRQHKRIAAERYSMEHADFIIAPCKEVIFNAKKQKIKLSEKQQIVPNPARVPVNWKNIESQFPTILFVGRLDFGKGLQYLPQMIRYVQNKIPKVKFEIVGGDSYARGIGSMLQWLRKRIASESGAVRFLGILGQKELNQAFKRAWVVVIPSRWDTFPNVALEAMARSKAIVASPFGGTKEILEGTGNIIANPATEEFARAVCVLCANKSLRRQIGKKGRRKIDHEYLPEYIAKKYISFLKELL